MRAGDRRYRAGVQAALLLLDVRDAQAVLSGITEKVTQCRNLASPHPVVNDLAAAVNRATWRYREQLARLAQTFTMNGPWPSDAFPLTSGFGNRHRCLRMQSRLPRRGRLWRRSLDSFGRAWAWKRATAWLERFSAEHSANVADEITQTERRLQETTQTLVALKAWKSCMEKLASNPMQQGALTAWQQMVKKIGKGTGKYAETYRRDARKYMQQCRNAIPAWIMPLYRVAEQVEAEPEIFDVVIVDEASQTGPEGLILQYLAKQCVIVGDDKQISPEGGFVEGSQVRDLDGAAS